MKLKLLLLSIITFSANVYSQQAKIAKANKSYENLAYIDAIKTYERVAEKGYKSADIFKKLGNAYYFNAELDKANRWYSEFFAMNEDVEPEYYFRYSQTLKSVGNYDLANKMLDEFNKKEGDDLRAKLFEENKNYLAVIEDNSGKYSVENTSINSEHSDYGTTIYGDKLIFSSTRKSGGSDRKIQKWNNQSFTGLYSSIISTDGKLQTPERFAVNIDSKFNESTPVFTKDGKTMYFTRNNYNNGKLKKDINKVTLLKLYKATIDKVGRFTNIVELPFSSNEYSTAHPSLSPDEKTLYFASDMPGSLGQSDIYKVAINTDGSFGTPINIGNKVNTEGKETFPFISGNNELYFSSDGHPGLGGLDVFVSKIASDDSFGNAVNLGKPINSPMDDFAFIIDSKTQKGYFSSNRSGGQGYDDIYKLKKLVCEQLLAGKITDGTTSKILSGVKLSLFDEKMNKISEIYSTKEGDYSFDNVECGKKYYVRAELKEYETIEKPVLIEKVNGKTELPIVIEKTVFPVKTGDDLAIVFKIKIIYFDSDRWNIRPDAALDLAKIIEVMKENPKMKVDVRSHTDSRQTHSYNEMLSDKRAKATIAWMMAQGVSADRLSGRGYGETQPLNHCIDGVPCSEDEYQQNRRSEFIITAL